jgi:hypothetical protein
MTRFFQVLAFWVFQCQPRRSLVLGRTTHTKLTGRCVGRSAVGTGEGVKASSVEEIGKVIHVIGRGVFLSVCWEKYISYNAPLRVRTAGIIPPQCFQISKRLFV